MNNYEILQKNEKAWDKVAEKFIGAEALPYWHPLDSGEFVNLIGDIKEKTFLEIACGSGNSIRYLIDNGAKKVFGFDFSAEQIKYAHQANEVSIVNGKVELFHQEMEKDFGFDESLDTVFSIYGFGWTQDPEIVLKNIYKSLKKGGKFIWSWDHPLCTLSEIKDGELVLVDPYQDSQLVKRSLFGSEVYQQVLSISHWFKLVQESGFKVNKFIETFNKSFPEKYNDHNGYYGLEKLKKIPSSMIWVLEK